MAVELRNLRMNANLTHSQLSERSGESKPQISRLENAHIADQHSVMHILGALSVSGEEWNRIMTLTREATGKGWWDTCRGMGLQQTLRADLEAGAISIREYHQAFLPELLQTPEYVQARWNIGNKRKPMESTVHGFVKGNALRQLMLRRPNGPTYEAVIEETSVRRLSALPAVFKQQLYHLVETVGNNPKLSLLVLPIDASISGYNSSPYPFSLFSYCDDPAIVVISPASADQVLSDSTDLAVHENLYAAIRKATYSQEKSLDFIAELASQITEI